MYYSYVEIEYVATSFSPARTDLALKLLMKVSSTKQSLHTAKKHGLSLQLIHMELLGFNVEPEWKDLISGEYNHLQMIFYKLGKIFTSGP
jgi:hypothetical protein